MKRPCECNNAIKGEYDKSQCRACWLFLNDQRYTKLWTQTGNPIFFNRVIKKPCNCGGK